MKRIILAGGSGFVGSALVPALRAKGYEPIVLGRGETDLQWDGKHVGEWANALEGAQAVVNLTGKNINCRHTKENRREITSSRVDSVRALGEAIARCAAPPEVFVQASGVGYYGDTGDRVADEDSPAGNDFPAEVCQLWEGAFDALDLPATRKIVLRLGVVLGRDGGALPMLEKLTRWFLGGAVGNGKQFISWIHVADIVPMFEAAIKEPELSGIFNATFPYLSDLVGQIAGSGNIPTAQQQELLSNLVQVLLKTAQANLSTSSSLQAQVLAFRRQT